ncbi:MAG: hypothetical protein ABFD81_10195 [Syntrophaceae bacterium]
MNSVGVYIPDLVEGDPVYEIERGMQPREAIERLQANFRRSVQSVLDVEVGPALEGLYTEEQIKELAADWAEEAING